MTSEPARRSQSDDAVAALFQTEAVTLLGFFLRRTSDREDAADLVAETALVLWRRATDLPADPAEQRMWLYGIARNVLSTHRRGIIRRIRLADRLRDELALSTSTPDPRIDELRAAVDSLPPRDRELVGLVHWEGFTISDAGRIIGLKPGAAAMRYHRARKRLVIALN